MKVVLISMPDVAPIIIHEMAASRESKEIDFIIQYLHRLEMMNRLTDLEKFREN